MSAESLNVTTRRSPRPTLPAFGLDATSANPITHYRRPRDERASGWVLAIVIGISLACLLAHYGAT